MRLFRAPGLTRLRRHGAAGLPLPGFSFSSARVLAEVPYTPLPHLFFGEETAMAVRLWTHGWDFYAPNTHAVFHLWSRTHRSNFRYGTAQCTVRRVVFLSCTSPTVPMPHATENTPRARRRRSKHTPVRDCCGF